MSRFTVTSTPQGIFPDGGVNDAVSIVNTGSYTVFLDSDSSVSQTTSYPLPPGSTAVWEARRALWVRCMDTALVGVTSSIRPTSTLVITRNSYQANVYRSNQGMERLFVSAQAPSLEFTSDDYSPLETSQYNCIVIHVKYDKSVSIASTQCMTFHGVWYDADGNRLAEERYQAHRMPHNFSGDVLNTAIYTIPVRGDRFTWDVKETSGFPDPLATVYSVAIYGTTRELAPRVQSFGNSVQTVYNDTNIDLEVGVTSDYMAYILPVDLTSEVFYLNSYSQKLRVGLPISSGVPGAGSFIRLLNYSENGGIILQEYDIAAAQDRYSTDFDIPSTARLAIHVNLVTATPAALTFSWLGAKF